MAIRNVNGRNVYVLEPREATGKTTSGKNWATLYSDLRWQVWEQIQKNEAAKLQLEAQGAQIERDYYNQQRRELQGQIDDLRKMSLKAQTDTLDPMEVKTKAAAALGKIQGVGGVSGYTTVEKKPLQSKMTGKFRKVGGGTTTDPKEAVYYDVVKTRTPFGSEPRPELAELEKYYKDIIAAKPEEVAGRARDTSAIDAEVARLEAVLSGLTPPTTSLDADLLARSQRAYEQNVGVMGAGGGAFGLAPRPRRILPRVDQQLAQQRIEDFVGEVGQEKAYRQDLNIIAQDLVSQRQELEAKKAELLGDEQSGQRTRWQTNLADIDKQLGAIDQDLAFIKDYNLEPTPVQLAMSSPDFVPREAGDFLLRGRTGIDVSGFKGRDRTGRTKTKPEDFLPPAPPFEDTTEDEFVPPPAPPATIPTGVVPAIEPIPVRPNRIDLEELDVEIPPVSPTPPFRATPTAPPAPPIDFGELPEPVIPPITPTPPPAPEIDPETLFITYGPLIEGQLDTSVTDSEKAIVANEWRKLIQAGNAPVSAPEATAWYATTLESIRQPSGRQGKASTKQRKDRYAINVVAEGVKLAEKPKKLERLAKTKSDQANRPSHIVLVDKLYETNRGKANAFKMTYDEISRVFSTDPAKRKEAHTYLVAKDTMESNITEPLA